jgi:hypothetical protein
MNADERELALMLSASTYICGFSTSDEDLP